MRVIVCGSRNWTDADIIRARLAQLPDRATIITGGCSGADAIAYAYVIATNARNHFRSEVFPAAWHIHGKAAGPIRNKAMLDSGADIVIAFHPDLAASKGTRHMVSIARGAGVPVEIITGREER